MSDDDRAAPPVALPTSRLGRLSRMAKLGLRAGASLIGKDDGVSAAQQAAEVLGTLRGLAAKMGQMASYVDGIVPEGQRDAYETSMKALRSAAPRSSIADVRLMIKNELGDGTRDVEELFAEWDDTPMASASIGQVHRARLHDGREVAVKVQHSGIARAVESDLANAGVLEGMIGVMGGRRLDSKQVLEVIRTRFREELDYGLEADRIEHFLRVHAGDPTVRIPAVVRERSTQHVLTTELARGLDFDTACTRSEAERRAWAETLWRFVFKGNLVGAMFNADPHPGNYIFQDDGQVSFIDFGCVQTLPEERLRHAHDVHHAALLRDEQAFRRAVRAMVGSKPGPLEEMAVAYSRRCFNPIFESPYRITREYAASLVGGMAEMAKLARNVPDEQLFNMPADMVFVNRLQFGFYSVLARLDVELDYAAVERGFLS